MPKPFKIYRIICTATDKSLAYGSDWPNRPVPFDRYSQGRAVWYGRGGWTSSGVFWKTENSVRKHLHRLCLDWRWAPPRDLSRPYVRDTWLEPVPNSLNWSRLQLLRIEQIYVSNYATTTLLASDFMGVPVEVSAQ